MRNSNERGMALVLVMLLTVGVAALAAGAIFLTSSANLISKGHEREEDMRNAADAGIELGRSSLNGNPTQFPDTGYRALATNQQVTDAVGNPIAGVTRSIYFGPTGSSTGQYGIFGSVVSVIQDAGGAVVVRRGELAQESFAKFAYYTDSEGSGICFGGGDQIFGPLHTNANMCIYSSTARFRGPVEVSGTITGTAYGTFDQGYLERGAVIPLPTMADLAKLNIYATQGGMSFTAPAGAVGVAQARIRIEFLSIDLDGDGRVTGPTEGFFRVFMDSGKIDAGPMTATRPTTPNLSINCGDFHATNFGNTFFSANFHRLFAVNGHASTPGTTPATNSLTTGSYRCFLAGSERLNVTGTTVNQRNYFRAADSLGYWVRYTDAPPAEWSAGLKNTASNAVDTTQTGRDSLAKYLWPISRLYNNNTKGVIYVAGKLLLSGVLNGRVTVASSDNITIADDLQYAVAPGSAPCLSSNMLGLLSAGSVYMADNTINAPWDPGSGYRNYDDSNDDFLQAVVLTLNSFTAENYSTGSGSAQPCQGTNWGRGCLYLTGGIIQGTRGAVGTSGGTGYIKRYAYDVCAFQTPPPYFPTTGRFIRNRYYEIDPVGFSVGQFFEDLRPSP
jgi:hypothetical protein